MSFTQTKIKIIITGTGRCGTLYISKLLSFCNIFCGHETIFDNSSWNQILQRIYGNEELKLSKVAKKHYGDYLKDNIIVGDTRSISWAAHFFSATNEMAGTNLQNLRILESLVYPDNNINSIVSPPPIARIRCGDLLSNDELCVVLKSYTVKFPTDVAWQTFESEVGTGSYMPIKFDVDMTFEVVYQTIQLPNSSKILNFGG